MKKTLIFIGLLLLVMTEMSSAAVSFKASVNRNPLRQGEQFQVSFVLENAQGSNFKAPTFKGFSVLRGPSQSSSMSNYNGRMSQSLTYSYILRADNPGNFSIGTASVKANGRTYRTQSLRIKVEKGSAASNKQGRNQNSQDRQAQNNKSLEKQAHDMIKERLFLKTYLSKKNVYIGEPLVVTYKYYLHPEIVNQTGGDRTGDPVFNGFWTHDLDLGRIEYKNETLNKVGYKVAVLKKSVLVPQQSGKLKIDPMVLDCSVKLRVSGQQQQRRRRSMFDDFFDRGNYRNFAYKATSPKLTVNVKPLPEPAPASFDGAVGDLSMKAWTDKRKTKTNEPITLKVEISGKGNLRLIEPLDILFPPDFEAYDPKVTDNVSINAGGISGKITFEYLLIPRNAGNFKIDPVEFSYFDPKAKEYKTIVSESLNVEVEQGDGTSSAQSITGVSKEQVKYIGKDVRFIKKATSSLSKNNVPFFGSFSFIGLMLTPIIMLLILIAYKKKSDKTRGNQTLLRTKKATKVARKRLATAKKLMPDNDDKFYEELGNGLWGYLSDKLSIPYSELTKESASNAMLAANAEQGITDKCMETIDKCEFARFAPSSDSSSREKVYNDAVTVITDLEAVLK
ncbi:MAG: BatD family protein [Candidatus Kapabacteria bacterium]|jgi:hypothetical protein|nr:BatD family protein [Candidatus Kapabacteria bacterium]